MVLGGFIYEDSRIGFKLGLFSGSGSGSFLAGASLTGTCWIVSVSYGGAA